jgi:RimJ/RimL family protein N-acetyltransferase
MSSDLYAGQLVRLAIFDPTTDAALVARWGYDSEYQRLIDMDPARLWSPKTIIEWFEKDAENEITFAIRTLEGDRLIGMVSLSKPDLAGNSWVGIGIGDRQDWGKGYGTEAMRLALKFGFNEVNLQRVSLDVFEYNPRAIRSYEKAGFKHEGCLRQCLLRDGQRWDLIYMSILRSEWEQTIRGVNLAKNLQSGQ